MSDIASSPVDDKRVVLFDNVCNLCSGSVRFILRWNGDRSIKFASVQSAFGHRVLTFYGLPTDAFETLLYIEDDRLYTKSTAALRIARRLTLPWRLLGVLEIVPRRVRDWLYDRIALNRYRLFGKRTRCFLPHKAVLERFLDA